MNKKVKYVLVSLFITGLVAGIYYFVRFQVQLYNIAAVQKNRVDILENFLTKSFPDQVKSYVDTRKATQQ